MTYMVCLGIDSRVELSPLGRLVPLNPQGAFTDATGESWFPAWEEYVVDFSSESS